MSRFGGQMGWGTPMGGGGAPMGGGGAPENITLEQVNLLKGSFDKSNIRFCKKL